MVNKIRFRRNLMLPYVDLEGESDTRGYNLGVIHFFPTMTAAFDEIVKDVELYNLEYPDGGFNPDPAFIALSLIRAMELGLVYVVTGKEEKEE